MPVNIKIVNTGLKLGGIFFVISKDNRFAAIAIKSIPISFFVILSAIYFNLRIIINPINPAII